VMRVRAATGGATTATGGAIAATGMHRDIRIRAQRRANACKDG
jgi:hypothetical protein